MADMSLEQKLEYARQRHALARLMGDSLEENKWALAIEELKAEEH